MSRRKAPASLTDTSSLGLGLGLNDSEVRRRHSLDDNDLDDDDDDSPTTPLLSLRIKSSKPDAQIHVPPTMTISDVKDVVRKKALGWSESQDRYLRLVCKGRLLAPDTALLEEFHVRTGDVVHAVLAAAGVRGGQQAALSRGWTTATTVILPDANGNNSNGAQPLSSSTPTPAPPTMTRRYRGTIIGPGGRVLRAPDDDDDDNDMDGDEDEDNGNYSEGDDPNDIEHGRHRGLDRLRVTHRLSRQEVRALRTYFSRHLELHGLAMREAAGMDVESQPLARWRVEDDWMAAQGPLSEFRINVTPRNGWGRNNGGNGDGADGNRSGNSIGTANWERLLRQSNNGTTTTTRATGVPGTDRDFMWGFTLGFIVGFFMLVWVWMPTVPHKQKLGILTGISFRLAVEVLGGSDDEEENRRKRGVNGPASSDGDDYGYQTFDYELGQ